MTLAIIYCSSILLCCIYECQTTCIRGRFDRLWVNTTVCTDIKNTKIKLECGMCLSQWSLLLVSEVNSAVCIVCEYVCVREREGQSKIILLLKIIENWYILWWSYSWNYPIVYHIHAISYVTRTMYNSNIFVILALYIGLRRMHNNRSHVGFCPCMPISACTASRHTEFWYTTATNQMVGAANWISGSTAVD